MWCCPEDGSETRINVECGIFFDQWSSAVQFWWVVVPKAALSNQFISRYLCLPLKPFVAQDQIISKTAFFHTNQPTPLGHQRNLLVGSVLLLEGEVWDEDQKAFTGQHLGCGIPSLHPGFANYFSLMVLQQVLKSLISIGFQLCLSNITKIYSLPPGYSYDQLPLVCY